MSFIKSLPMLFQKIDNNDITTLNIFNEAVQDCILSGSCSFQFMIQQTKEQLLKPNDENQLSKKDQEMMQQEDIIYKNDQKQRQLQLDQEKDDLEINKIDFNDYLNKYKKKYPLSKIKSTNQSQTNLIKKQTIQNEVSTLIIKESIDLDTSKSPQLLSTQTTKKPVLKSKTPTSNSVCDIKKQFKLPSIKKRNIQIQYIKNNIFINLNIKREEVQNKNQIN